MTAPKIHIRPARPADLDAIVRLDQGSFSDPWPRSGWFYELNDNPNAYLWVAENGVVTTSVVSGTTEVVTALGRSGIPTGNGEIIGLLAAWLVLDELHIGTLAVQADHRRRGIGARMLEVGLREGIAHGITLSHLEVRKSNLSAQALYHRFGFEIVGERKRYYADNYEDALLMSVYGLGEAYLHWLETGRQTPWAAGRSSNSNLP